MRGIVATVTGRGQITLPAEIRRRLNAKTGDKLEFIIDEEHEAILLRLPLYPDVASLRGAAGRLEQPLPWKEVLRIAREDGINATGAEEL